MTNCYVPGAGGGDTLFDLGTMGVDLVRTGAAANTSFGADAHDGGVPCIVSNGTTDNYFSGTVGALPSMAESLTVRVLWRCQQATGSVKGIFSYGPTATSGGPDILIQAHAGALRLYVNANYRITLSGELANGVLYDIVVTYSDSENLWRLYVNGVDRGTYASTQSSRDQPNLYLGHGFNGAAAGNYIACMVWDRCLSLREVWSLYEPTTSRDIWLRPRVPLWLNAAGGGTTHEVSASFGASSGLAPTGVVSLEGALTFALSSAVTLSSVLQSDGAVGLATSSSVALGATHQTGATSALGVSSGASDSSDMIAETGFPLGVAGGLLGSVQLTSDVSASLGVDQGVQTVAGLSLDAAVSLAQDQGVSLSSLITIEGAVAFGASVAASASETADYAAVLALSQAPGIAASNVSVLQGVAVLSQSAGAAASGQANYAASVSVTISPGVVSASGLDQDVSVALAAALSEAITAATTNITAPVGRTISVQASGHTISVAARTITIRPLAN